jgi:hypothetical protein
MGLPFPIGATMLLSSIVFAIKLSRRKAGAIQMRCSLRRSLSRIKSERVKVVQLVPKQSAVTLSDSKNFVGKIVWFCLDYGRKSRRLQLVSEVRASIEILMSPLSDIELSPYVFLRIQDCARQPLEVGGDKSAPRLRASKS